MDEKQKASWRRVRARGQLRYALLYGGVLWGLSAALLFVAGDLVFHIIQNGFTISLFGGLPFGRYVFQTTVFYLSGVILGMLMWKRYEREYSESA